MYVKYSPLQTLEFIDKKIRLCCLLIRSFISVLGFHEWSMDSFRDGFTYTIVRDDQFITINNVRYTIGM